MCSEGRQAARAQRCVARYAAVEAVRGQRRAARYAVLRAYSAPPLILQTRQWSINVASTQYLSNMINELTS